MRLRDFDPDNPKLFLEVLAREAERPVAERLEEIDRELAQVERRLGKSHDELVDLHRRGELKDTVDACNWWILMDLRERVS